MFFLLFFVAVAAFAEPGPIESFAGEMRTPSCIARPLGSTEPCELRKTGVVQVLARSLDGSVKVFLFRVHYTLAGEERTKEQAAAVLPEFGWAVGFIEIGPDAQLTRVVVEAQVTVSTQDVPVQ